MASVTPLRLDEVPDELICAICFSIPLKPKLLSCEHVFCANCIRRALDTQTSCPTCRTSCSQYDVRDLSRSPFAFRIWSNVQVKCDQSESGCAWTGSISDLESHQQNNCSAGNRTNVDQEELDRLKQENTRLKEEIERMKEAKKEVCDQLSHVTDSFRDIENKLNKLENENDILPKIFDSYYNYNRHNVVQLSQLISRYLENKPYYINSNRIYNCVQSCYRDLETGYSDNPKHYYLDMRMLLSTCVASNWFSDKQDDNIRGWIRSYFS